MHEREPEKFTDTNHKPEIALALGPFEAFVGWKPLDDIKALLDLDCLKQFLPIVKKHDFDDQQLKGTCEAMLKADEQTVASVGEALKKLPKSAFGKDAYIPDLLPRLWDQYSKTVSSYARMLFAQLTSPGQRHAGSAHHHELLVSSSW